MYDASPQERQTRTRQTPQTPPAPQAPTAPEVPRTPEQLQALANQRTELKHQLESVTDRREELADQLEDADPAARPGLETGIQMLDDRSARLEREILHADDAIAVAVAGGVGQAPSEEETTAQPSDENVVSKDGLANVMLAEAVAFVLLGVFFYRWVLRRTREQFSRGAPDDSRRLDQLQNSVDAIAVEVERISEGQRYVTKALNEGVQPAAGGRAGEEALVHRKGT
jgi:chaperonin cofactor prefoldin